MPISVGRLLKKHLRQEASSYASSRNELVYCIRELQKSSCMRRIIALLNRRDYSSKELRDKLSADGYWSDVIDTSISQATEGNLINDGRYADAFIRTKVYAGWGESRIARTLRQRGIDVDALEGWPEAYLPSESEEDRAFELASRRRFGGKDPYAKAVRFLCARGFSLHIANAVASRMRAQGLI